MEQRCLMSNVLRQDGRCLFRNTTGSIRLRRARIACHAAPFLAPFQGAVSRVLIPGVAASLDPRLSAVQTSGLQDKARVIRQASPIRRHRMPGMNRVALIVGVGPRSPVWAQPSDGALRAAVSAGARGRSGSVPASRRQRDHRPRPGSISWNRSSSRRRSSPPSST